MSLHISLGEFLKMLDKECLKKTGLSLNDFPTIFGEDYWPDPLRKEIKIQEAKTAMETCIEDIINTINP
jgi:hypothetical protein